MQSGETPTLSSEGITFNGIKEDKKSETIQQFTVFPNPTSDKINLSYHINESDIVSIKLINNIGQVVRIIENQLEKSEGTYNLTVERGTLPDGVYNIIFTSKGYKHNSKVVLH